MPGSYCPVPAGLVAVLPVNLVMEVQLSSSRAPYAAGTIAKSQFGQIWLKLAQHAVLGLLNQKRLVPKGRLRFRRTMSCGCSVVPSGLPAFFCRFPSTPCWANFSRPCGTVPDDKRSSHADSSAMRTGSPCASPGLACISNRGAWVPQAPQ